MIWQYARNSLQSLYRKKFYFLVITDEKTIIFLFHIRLGNSGRIFLNDFKNTN